MLMCLSCRSVKILKILFRVLMLFGNVMKYVFFSSAERTSAFINLCLCVLKKFVFR